MRAFVALVAALALAACAQREEATPALWEVTGPGGERGYLFGTIHALDDDLDWRSDAFERAYAASDTLVVEAAGITDSAATARIWQRLALTPGQGLLSRRVGEDDLGALFAVLKLTDYGDNEFANVESWAAALTLADAASDDDGDGVDLALLRDTGTRRVDELEGVAGQLGIFDRLPPAEQSDLLAAVAKSAVADPAGPARLERLWRAGDIEAIAAETRKGLLADPELREALLVGRNRDWAAKVEAMLRAGERPFVAVGAAHLAGPDGLPAMLAARGYTVTRLQ